jgi:hypothetical protein
MIQMVKRQVVWSRGKNRTQLMEFGTLSICKITKDRALTEMAGFWFWFFSFFVLLGFELKALPLLGKYSTT